MNEKMVHSDQLGNDLASYARNSNATDGQHNRWLEALRTGAVDPETPDAAVDGGFGDLPPED